jgi:hypothetical protein
MSDFLRSDLSALVLESPRAAIIILLMREVMTENLEKVFDEAKLGRIVVAFRHLMEAAPQEKHFSIKFCNFDEGRGKEVWCIIDEYAEEEGGLTATYLLPKDY